MSSGNRPSGATLLVAESREHAGKLRLGLGNGAHELRHRGLQQSQQLRPRLVQRRQARNAAELTRGINLAADGYRYRNQRLVILRELLQDPRRGTRLLAREREDRGSLERVLEA